MAEALVGADQEGLVGAVAAADGGLDGTVGAGDAGDVGERGGAGRDHRAVDRVEVVEIHAAQLFVDVVAEGEIGGDGEIAGHLALHADAQMLRLGRDEILHEEIAAGLEDVDVADREVGVVGIDVQLLDGGGADGGQDQVEQGAGEGRGHADIQRRSGGQAGKGNGVGDDRTGQRQVTGAERARGRRAPPGGFRCSACRRRCRRRRG